MNTKQLVKEARLYKEITEMADAHCHLDLIADARLVHNAIDQGVKTIITNGIDTKSNLRNLELADGRHIFAALGVDPEHANMADEELEFNIGMVRQHSGRIVGIGEIGLDYGRVKENAGIERQKFVFARFLDLAKELNLPVSIHSREALDDVLRLLEERGIESAHIHFFEGNVRQAKEVERKGYMISIPPLQSSRRGKIIKEIAIDNIMAESDAPAAGLTPMDVERSIRIVADSKGIDFRKAADLLTQNTKRFFRIKKNGIFMRY